MPLLKELESPGEIGAINITRLTALKTHQDHNESERTIARELLARLPARQKSQDAECARVSRRHQRLAGRDG